MIVQVDRKMDHRQAFLYSLRDFKSPMLCSVSAAAAASWTRFSSMLPRSTEILRGCSPPWCLVGEDMLEYYASSQLPPVVWVDEADMPLGSVYDWYIGLGEEIKRR
ncbi:hypothetical protein J3459_012400 [Metarhizium acridum]|nr:hypothetical protein J3459_012400 [Metarhizium acridum]